MHATQLISEVSNIEFEKKTFRHLRAGSFFLEVRKLEFGEFEGYSAEYSFIRLFYC